jgi:hypothetical protein
MSLEAWWVLLGDVSSAKITPMVITPRRLLLPATLMCAVTLSGCSSNGPASSDVSAPEETKVSSAPAATPTPTASPTESSPAPAVSSSASAQEEAAVTLEQTFTSPDGYLSFRYPAGWTVSVPEGGVEERVSRWTLRDAEGEQVLSLSVRPDEDMYKVSPPLTPVVMPQGAIPGVTDMLGSHAQAAVASTPGQSRGGDAGVLYGMTSATGADPVFGDLRWGDEYLLSFSGYQRLGPNDVVDMTAGAEQFAASPRFRHQILPIIQSFTASSPGPHYVPGSNSTPGAGLPTGAPERGAGATCVGARYSYLNLQGVTCQEAQEILQLVSDTGEPIGARGRRTTDYHCFWSSIGEVEEGYADVVCKPRNSDGLVAPDSLFDAYFLNPKTTYNG